RIAAHAAQAGATVRVRLEGAADAERPVRAAHDRRTVDLFDGRRNPARGRFVELAVHVAAAVVAVDGLAVLAAGVHDVGVGVPGDGALGLADVESIAVAGRGHARGRGLVGLAIRATRE